MELSEHLQKLHNLTQDTNNRQMNTTIAVYKCKICDYKTTRITILAKHMSIEHGEENEVSYSNSLVWNHTRLELIFTRQAK